MSLIINMSALGIPQLNIGSPKVFQKLSAVFGLHSLDRQSVKLVGGFAGPWFLFKNNTVPAAISSPCYVYVICIENALKYHPPILHTNKPLKN